MYLKQCKRFIWLIFTEWGKERDGGGRLHNLPIISLLERLRPSLSSSLLPEPPELFILKTFQAKTQGLLARLVDGEGAILAPVLFAALRKA